MAGVLRRLAAVGAILAYLLVYVFGPYLFVGWWAWGKYAARVEKVGDRIERLLDWSARRR